MDALREHLPVLGLHWIANVKDAVRLKQVTRVRVKVTTVVPIIESGT